MINWLKTGEKFTKIHVNSRKNSRKFTKICKIWKNFQTTVAVVVSFFICWLPFHAQRLLASYLVKDENQNQFLLDIYLKLTYISGVMYYLSSTINPLLYQLMSAKFRLAFKETFRCSLFKCAIFRRRSSGGSCGGVAQGPGSGILSGACGPTGSGVYQAASVSGVGASSKWTVQGHNNGNGNGNGNSSNNNNNLTPNSSFRGAGLECGKWAVCCQCNNGRVGGPAAADQEGQLEGPAGRAHRQLTGLGSPPIDSIEGNGPESETENGQGHQGQNGRNGRNGQPLEWPPSGACHFRFGAAELAEEEALRGGALREASSRNNGRRQWLARSASSLLNVAASRLARWAPQRQTSGASLSECKPFAHCCPNCPLKLAAAREDKERQSRRAGGLSIGLASGPSCRLNVRRLLQRGGPVLRRAESHAGASNSTPLLCPLHSNEQPKINKLGEQEELRPQARPEEQRAGQARGAQTLLKFVVRSSPKSSGCGQFSASERSQKSQKRQKNCTDGELGGPNCAQLGSLSGPAEERAGGASPSGRPETVPAGCCAAPKMGNLIRGAPGECAQLELSDGELDEEPEDEYAGQKEEEEEELDELVVVTPLEGSCESSSRTQSGEGQPAGSQDSGALVTSAAGEWAEQATGSGPANNYYCPLAADKEAPTWPAGQGRQSRGSGEAVGGAAEVAQSCKRSPLGPTGSQRRRRFSLQHQRHGWQTSSSVSTFETGAEPEAAPSKAQGPPARRQRRQSAAAAPSGPRRQRRPAQDRRPPRGPEADDSSQTIREGAPKEEWRRQTAAGGGGGGDIMGAPTSANLGAQLSSSLSWSERYLNNLDGKKLSLSTTTSGAVDDCEVASCASSGPTLSQPHLNIQPNGGQSKPPQRLELELELEFELEMASERKRQRRKSHHQQEQSSWGRGGRTNRREASQWRGHDAAWGLVAASGAPFNLEAAASDSLEIEEDPSTVINAHQSTSDLEVGEHEAHEFRREQFQQGQQDYQKQQQHEADLDLDLEECQRLLQPHWRRQAAAASLTKTTASPNSSSNSSTTTTITAGPTAAQQLAATIAECK